MFKKKRIPIEDMEALERILLSEDWPIIIKYLGQLTEVVEKEIITASEHDNLVLLKGRGQGARRLYSLVCDLKKFYKEQYSVID